MAYYWIGSGSLSRVGGNDVQPGDEFEPTDAELRSFNDQIEERTETEDDAPEEPVEESDESEETDYASMDYSELRQLAVDADTDEIDGRSSKADIIAYFEG